MKNKWSLEGKGINGLEGYHGLSYNEKDIETLRQKLIEILDIWIKNEIPIKAYEGLLAEINKLFGVNDAK